MKWPFVRRGSQQKRLTILTLTPLRLRLETKVNLRRSLFGRLPSVAITSTKSATGHLLGAAGGIEAIFTIQALRDQMVPPTLNLHHPDENAEGLNLVALVAAHEKMRYALSNGFWFGGVNASLLLKRWYVVQLPLWKGRWGTSTRAKYSVTDFQLILRNVSLRKHKSSQA